MKNDKPGEKLRFGADSARDHHHWRERAGQKRELSGQNDK